MKILGFIPARGGSKGVPRKNIRPLAGKSLIQRTFETAQMSQQLDRIILSTDDEAIAAHATEIGLEVPFMRPAQLASDKAPMIEVIIHMLETLKQEEGYVPDAVMLLQPTSPTRKLEDINRACQLLEEYDSVCSVIPVPLELCPHYVMKIKEDGFLDYFLAEGKQIKRRQDVVPAYKREGTVYLTKTAIIYSHKNLYGDRCKPMIIMEESINIDTWEDWEKAERLLLQQTEISN